MYDGDDIVAEVDSQAGLVTYLQGLAIDEPFVRQTATDNEYYHADGLGSTVVLSNDAGTLHTAYTYDPFGKTTVSGPSTNAFQYTSRENDETGLYYYRARYYSPTLHRFISEDPIGLEGGDENFYAYTFNAPTVYTDPSGTYILQGIGCYLGAKEAISGRKPSLGTVVRGIVGCGVGAIGGGAAKVAFKGLGAAARGLGAAAKKIASRFGKSGNKTLRGSQNPKVAEAAKRGRQAHRDHDYGPGFEKEVTLPSGKRADAVNWNSREVVELKPNNPNAIRSGERQVEGYRQELERITGECWTCRVETY